MLSNPHVNTKNYPQIRYNGPKIVHETVMHALVFNYVLKMDPWKQVHSCRSQEHEQLDVFLNFTCMLTFVHVRFTDLVAKTPKNSVLQSTIRKNPSVTKLCLQKLVPP